MPVREGGRYVVDPGSKKPVLDPASKPKDYAEPKPKGERVGGERGAPEAAKEPAAPPPPADEKPADPPAADGDGAKPKPAKKES
jgi:hypothetical protein